MMIELFQELCVPLMVTTDSGGVEILQIPPKVLIA
jgi:hypothetical protein